ncbi:VPLPA-CTERM sorting domain-containing protein [Pseudomonadota bacterium]
MKRTALASAIALTLGTAATAQAATITISEMAFNGSYGASGTMNDAGSGVMTSTDNFFGNPWTATQQSWFDTHSSVSTWAGTTGTGAYGDYSYTFHLTGNQVAAGTFFDWAGSNGIPVLTIYDCPVSGGGACTGVSAPMQTLPFPGQSPGFNGTTADDFPVSGVAAVPVPAAVWLFGSGLVGLVGVARRRKQA